MQSKGNNQIKLYFEFDGCFLVFNATFNNISVIPWRSVLLVEETEEPWGSHRPVASHWQTWSHNGFEFEWNTTFVGVCNRSPLFQLYCVFSIFMQYYLSFSYFLGIKSRTYKYIVLCKQAIYRIQLNLL